MRNVFVLAASVALIGDAIAQVNQGAPVSVKITAAPATVTAVAFWKQPHAGAASATDGLYEVDDVVATSPTVELVAAGSYRYVLAIDPTAAGPSQPKNVVAAKDITGGIRLEWWDLEPANGGVLLGTQDVSGGGGRMILSAGQNFRYSGAPDNAEDLLFAQAGVTAGNALVGIWEASAGSGFGAVQSETIAANIVDIAAFDSNNDGIKDGLVLAVEDPAGTNDQIWVLVDDGSPFQILQQVDITDGTIGKIAVADYDGDGDDDILIGHGDAASGISGLRGTGIAGAPFETSPIVVAWPLQGSVPAPIVIWQQLDADTPAEFVAGFERVCASGDFNGIFSLRTSAAAPTYMEFWGMAPYPPVVQAVPSSNPDEFGGAQGEYLLYFWRGSQGQFQQGSTLLVAPGNDPTAPSRVRMLSTNAMVYGEIAPYPAAMGANVDSGDIRGSHPMTGTAGWPILTGPGASPAFGPHVRAFDGLLQAPISKVSFFGYGTLRYGVKPSSGDIDGDGYEEILTAPGPGAVFGPHIRGFNFDGATITAMAKVSLFAFGTLKFGANIAGGDLDPEGAYEEFVAGPGPGAVFGPQVRGFNYDAAQVTAIGKLNIIVPFSVQQGGANVGTGDTNGDGIEDAIVGSSAFGPSEITVATYGNSLILPVFVPFNGTRGASVSGGNTDGVGASEIVVAPHDDSSAPARFRILTGVGTATTSDYVAFPSSYGARVGTGYIY